MTLYLLSKKKIIIILFIYIFIFDCISIDKLYSLKDYSNLENNRGFLRIKTNHKSQFTYYNYTENIIVYEDLFINISYVPINESNSIIKSKRVSHYKYYQICEKKILLDKTKYKRSLKPKISVIIPFYNKDLFSIYIPLRSIQNQSLKDIEIIFVDDGSSENKINEIIREMENDNRIILLKHKKNKGTLTSRVDGVRYSSGEYILNLDQDDLFLDNLVFEKIYNKAKILNIDILQFSTLCYKNKYKKHRLDITIPRHELILQPDLRVAFFNKNRKYRLNNCATRMIWDKFVRRDIYLEAIEDLGDEYLNHKLFLFEDTLMMFELSQIARSYYYDYSIFGYRLNTYDQGKSRDASSNKKSILAMNQLYFIKLLLYKISPLYDRYHIYQELCRFMGGELFKNLNKKDFDLIQEILEVIDELERLYKNTDKHLLECAYKIKNYFGII